MILIVDDRAENIFPLRIYLERNGFEVDAAMSGEEALKKILKGAYELVILDVQMPGMDGFEVAEAMMGYSKARHIPIIFLSAASTDKNFIHKGYSSGGIDYVTKPYDPDILLLKVKTFHRLYEQTRQLNAIQDALRDEIEVRKAAQLEQLRKANELHSILESIPQVAFTAAADGTIDYVNSNWYLFADNKSSFPTPAAGMDLNEYWYKAIQEGRPFSLEVPLTRLKEHMLRYFLLRVLPVKEGERVVKWVGTFTDIHKQKLVTEILEQRVNERTQELRNMNEALEASNVDLQQFASVASHDLKEPLRKIQLFSSILREKFKGTVPAEMGGYLDKIMQSSERMARLITDLLTFSRLSVSGLFIQTRLNDLVTDILTDLDVIIEEKQAQIIVDELPTAEVIPGQMRQVFQNIIANALKFTVPGRRPVVHVTGQYVKDKQKDSPVTPCGPYCRITVTDNGIGFNELYLDKIFTIFQRLNAAEKFEGTGIGLAIAKKIIDKHNGLITAASVENQGASFIIVLPVRQELNESREQVSI